jgi:N-methylhydantoinase A
LHVGVDIGGTFTDLVLSDAGRLTIHKLLSTPDDPSRAMLAGLQAVTPGGLAALRQVSHGSTVATNAILERKGAKTALITTKGFRDLLFIGRQNRPQLYALQPTLPPPLIPRDLCFEVPERLDYTGAALTPLDIAALDAVLDGLAEQAVEAVAVCLLYSYINPAHEQAVRARILERGLLAEEQIALSCDVLPEFREYERASTVALDAYVRPVMSRYLRHLENQLPESCGLRVMKSDGGVFSAARARAQAVQTALSGPAAGVIGAFHVAKLAGYDQIITLDIGGTSTDVALCPGRPVQRPESEIDGLPLRIRLLDIETIGAGGGSIARVDAGGALRVGPESAGANPGPVCYGRGGTLPTVSDANTVLGRLDAAHFLGGRMTLDVEAARAALAELGGRMGVSAEAAAAGIIQVANASIDRAVRRVSVARGYDPRDFTLVAFGGAGPLHACEVAERLDIPRVLLPRYPGVMCALGLLVADVALEYSRSILRPLTDETVENIAAHLASMRQTGADDLTREGILAERQQFRPLLDMRYAGQAYELTIPLSLETSLTTDGLAEAFHAAHERAYGHALRGRAIEAVNLRLQAVGITDKPSFEPEATEAGNPINTPRPEGQKDAAGMRISLYDRDALRPGEAFDGPALAFQLDSTAYIPPGWRARVDVYRNLIVERR